MKRNGKKLLGLGFTLVFAFVVWTYLLQTADVKPIGQSGTSVGLSTLNKWFFEQTGVHMTLYTITDWLGLVPLFVCISFGIVGLLQMIKRKRFLKVDIDIILLGIYYIVVIFGYLIFETIPINYRPILIDGRLEASYPSSTTLLVLSVMPTLVFQVRQRIKNKTAVNAITILTALFSGFMVIGRMISGVHWFTDIVGGVLLSSGLFYIYKGSVLTFDKRHKRSVRG